MNQLNRHLAVSAPPEVLEDILSDALEIACKVPPEGRKLILGEIRKIELESGNITLHRGLSIAKLMIIVAEIMDIEEFWIYHPGTHTMRKLKGNAVKTGETKWRPNPEDWLAASPQQ